MSGRPAGRVVTVGTRARHVLRRRRRPRPGCRGGAGRAARQAREVPRRRAVLRAGPRIAVSRDSRYDAGDLVGAAAPAPARRATAGGRARVERRIGRPDVARDVIEALMVDRGLARSFDPAVERAARGQPVESVERVADRRAAVTCARCRRSRSIRQRPRLR